MKSIILARVSTEEQMQEGFSIPAQLQRAREYCNRKDLSIKNEYQFDESSIKDKRKKFDIVVNEIRSCRETVALVVETVDRLQRSFKESVLFDELRRSGKVELHFIRENLIIHKDSNGSEIQRWDIAVFGAKGFVLNISDNVKRTTKQKRNDGEWAGPAPLGYLNITLENGIKSIIPDPERFYIIVGMFERYATGTESMESIRTWANEIMNLRSKKGQKLNKSDIEHILHNTFYYGLAYSKKYNQYFPHKYEKLISKELFDRCQKTCENKRCKPIKTVSKDFIFKGIFTCEQCGCSITPEEKIKTNGKRYVYYSCTNGKHNCERDYAPESIFLEPLGTILNKFANITPETLELILSELKKRAESNKSVEDLHIQSLRKEKEDIEKQIEALIDTLASPNMSSITRERCDKKIQILNDQASIAEQKLSKYSGSTHGYEMGLHTIVSLAQRAKEIFESSEVDEKKRFLHYLLQNSQVRGRKPLFHLRSPYNTLLKSVESSEWLPG